MIHHANISNGDITEGLTRFDWLKILCIEAYHDAMSAECPNSALRWTHPEPPCFVCAPCDSLISRFHLSHTRGDLSQQWIMNRKTRELKTRFRWDVLPSTWIQKGAVLIHALECLIPGRNVRYYNTMSLADSRIQGFSESIHTIMVEDWTATTSQPSKSPLLP